MIDADLVLVAGALACTFLVCWTLFSLRDFSRSQLDAICRKHGNPERFGNVLKNLDRAQLSLELLGLGLVFAASVLVWNRFIAVGPATGGRSAQVIVGLRAAAAGVALVFSAVILPWTLARVRGESWIYRVWPLVFAWYSILQLALRMFYRLDAIVHRLFGVPEPEQDAAATLTEEIRTVVDEGQREGILESEARTMIHRVMELQDEDAAAIMTPRTDMICLQADTTVAEARERMLEYGHSRFPVIGESPDDIVGVLHAKDLLREWRSDSDHERPLRDIVREPYYVPETTGIDTLLQTMKREHVQMAIVLDEYSGVAGLVTMEDILEEIVGEIVDEYDVDEPDGIEVIEDGQIEVESWVHIDDLNERFGFALPEDGDFDTIGGFVYSQLARVPKQDEMCLWHELRITVLDADKRKVHKLRIEVDESQVATLADDA